MDNDKLIEERAQRILDHLDRDEFVFGMNDLEGEEYITLPNGTKILCDIMNGKINEQMKALNTKNNTSSNKNPLKEESKQLNINNKKDPLSNELLLNYINTFDSDEEKETKDVQENEQDNSIHHYYETEYSEIPKSNNSKHGIYKNSIHSNLDSEDDDFNYIPYNSTKVYQGHEILDKEAHESGPLKKSSSSSSSKPIYINHPSKNLLLATSPSVPCTPPPSLANTTTHDINKIFRSKDEILNLDKTTESINENLSEKEMEKVIEELLAKLTIQQDNNKNI